MAVCFTLATAFSAWPAAMLSTSGAGPRQSTAWVLDRVTLSSGGRTASPTYEMTLMQGQTSPVGAASACNFSYVSSLGFASVLGEMRVPVVLTVDKSPGDPETLRLGWSGAAESFLVYRSTSAADVLLLPDLVAESFVCDTTDSPIESSSPLFYKVVAAQAP